MKYSLSALVAALALPILSSAQTPPTAAEAVAGTAVIPRTALFGNPEKTQARISPDGKYISFIAPKDGVLNVWVGPRSDPSAAKAVTSDTKRGIRQHFWAYDNQHVLYIQDEGGDENASRNGLFKCHGSQNPFRDTRNLRRDLHRRVTDCEHANGFR